MTVIRDSVLYLRAETTEASLMWQQSNNEILGFGLVLSRIFSRVALLSLCLVSMSPSIFF